MACFPQCPDAIHRGSDGVKASIRRATPADAATLAELGATTFIESFGYLYIAQDLQAFLEEHHSEAAYAKALENPSYALWLAEQNGRAIGYAQAAEQCTLPHADIQQGDGEIKRLYLRADAQNSGVGRALMDIAMAWLLQHGPRTLWVSVYSENVGAQRFYQRYGFAFAGEYHFIVGDQHDREFIYRRSAS